VLVGRAFQVAGDNYTYRITAVLAPTQLQLNRAWVSASITPADQRLFTIAMDRYALPDDFDRPVDDWENVFSPYAIEPRTPNEFRDARRSDIEIRLEDPEIYTVFGLTDNQSAQMVHFNPYPKTARILQFPYQAKHPTIDSDQDKILYPSSYMEAFIDVMLQLANRDYDDNSVKTQQLIMDSFKAHAAQQANPGVTDGGPVLTPANSVRLSMRTAYGLPTMNIDWGEHFDTGEASGL
jgi:hypothetical protein